MTVVSTNKLNRGRASRALFATLLLFVSAGVSLALAPAAGAAAAAGPAPVVAMFTINGRAVSHTSDSNPIKLDPSRPAQVNLTVINNGPNPITVAAVALSGRALDITFFDFETQTALQVPPGSTQTQQYTLDFAPLNGQGDGLIPANIHILDDHRHVLASQNFTGDVRGRITSLFGLFAIEVTVFTIILFVGALLALARGNLHDNRFRRALRFVWPGLGLGIVIVFCFAILRIWVPSPGHWLPIVLICAAAGFVVGYLTPNPANDEVYFDEPEPEPEPLGSQTQATDPHATLSSAGVTARPSPTAGG